ncbi:MAG: trwC [Marmoricola sp.]|nr:trwC [Marmoricola sp.]
MAVTREQVAALNGAIRDRLVAAGAVDDRLGFVTGAGERLGVGDRVITRRNDRGLAVANRDTWTLTGINHDGTLTIYNRDAQGGSRSLPAAYGREHVELGYATTVHGAQGETTDTGHLLLGEHTSAAAAYVAMTRGRENNVAHLVAEDLDDARQLWLRRSAATVPTWDRATPHNAPPRTSRGMHPAVPCRSRWATCAPLGASNKTCAVPWQGPTGSAASWPAMATLTTTPDPRPSSRRSVRTSLPPLARCMHSFTNPPSDPCPRAG